MTPDSGFSLALVGLLLQQRVDPIAYRPKRIPSFIFGYQCELAIDLVFCPIEVATRNARLNFALPPVTNTEVRL